MLEDGRPSGRAMHPAPRVVAVIPARGGSKGLPGKNLAEVGGVPLVARAVRAAVTARRIDAVLVSTDDDRIAEVARAAGAGVVRRPADLSGDTATSESALLHALHSIAAHTGVRPDVLVFVQATSPFIDPAALDLAVERVQRGDEDVVFSAVPSHVFLWRETDAGADGVNHAASARPRRQDREPEYAETGAFYVMRADGFVQAGHRFFGRVGIAPVHPDHAVEIDDAADLARARMLAPAVDALVAGGDPRHPLIDVDAIVTDFDGVHTDDTAWVDTLGRESVRVSRSDGAGVARLRAAGIPVLILSAEANPVVARRAEKLGVECLHGVDAKGAALAEWAFARGLDLDRVAYVGNDRNDLPALELVGWPVAVRDAVPDVLAAARHVLDRAGGHGAVRELADLVIASRDHASREHPANRTREQDIHDHPNHERATAR
ncbi:acylneuraminate cytidylyltransferase [Agromyces sp. Leaf222]|uniref:acylneuraminate cytidylyltransferase n=1 Tax=Agromyces sp. Leaf222 TaxID=1735688 RepID=UPI0009EBE409|nr:acylneuraminate cytidylyltransferase [Agromyces sp. Leaf222]